MADTSLVNFEIYNGNFFPGRNGKAPKWIILHGTAGGSSAQGIATYFQTVQVSSHYVIGTDGTIVQCVAESDGAWANGFISPGADSWWGDSGQNPNNLTISIEHVKSSTDNSDNLTPAQEAASFALVNDICWRHNIPLRDADASGGITGHFSMDPVNRKNCPGSYPWDALFNPGTTNFSPPINLEGNPHVEQQLLDTYNSTEKLLMAAYGSGAWITSGIFLAWKKVYEAGHNFGPPLTLEYGSVDWNGNAINVVQFAYARAEYANGVTHFYDANNKEVYSA